MILFLDFDGVLHPVSAPASKNFSHLPRLEIVLRDFPEVRIVISSMWRADGLETCRKYFSDDIKTRIIGFTPFSDEVIRGFVVARTRGEEVLAWIKVKNYFGPWVALDDDKRGFPKKCQNLILCDSENAFDEVAEEKLRIYLMNALDACKKQSYT